MAASFAVEQGSLPSSTTNLGFHVAAEASGTTPTPAAAGILRVPHKDNDAVSGNNAVGRPTAAPSSMAPSPKIDAYSEIPDSIDSALLAALREPRERLGLLKLEQVFRDFLESQDQYWDVGGPYNSRVVSPSIGLLSNTADTRPQTTFQRCILHRLGDRFNISREAGVDGLIRLWKTPETQLPSRLLLDLDPSEYNQNNTLEQKMEQLTVNPAPKKPNRKMKIMKRNSNNVSTASDNSKSAPRKNKNFSDKEKAYAEARARIFKDSDEGESKPIPAPIPAPQSTSARPIVEPTPPISNNNYYVFAEPPNATPQYYLEDNDLGNSNQEASNRPSKATWRNRRQEENDPDFQRGGSMVVPPIYDYQYNPYFAAGQPQQPQPHDYYGTTNAVAATSPAYYNAAGGGGGGRGGGQGRGGGRGGYYPNVNPYNYRRRHPGGEMPANVHCMEEFPSLR